LIRLSFNILLAHQMQNFHEEKTFLALLNSVTRMSLCYLFCAVVIWE